MSVQDTYDLLLHEDRMTRENLIFLPPANRFRFRSTSCWSQHLPQLSPLSLTGVLWYDSLIHMVEQRLMGIASCKYWNMKTQCSSGLTDLAFLLRSTRNPSVRAGHPAVFQRDRDCRDGVPHCPWRRATLSTLKLPLASLSDEWNNLTGADTSHPPAGAMNNHSYWIHSGGCFPFTTVWQGC